MWEARYSFFECSVIGKSEEGVQILNMQQLSSFCCTAEALWESVILPLTFVLFSRVKTAFFIFDLAESAHLSAVVKNQLYFYSYKVTFIHHRIMPSTHNQKIRPKIPLSKNYPKGQKTFFWTIPDLTISIYSVQFLSERNGKNKIMHAWKQKNTRIQYSTRHYITYKVVFCRTRIFVN